MNKKFKKIVATGLAVTSLVTAGGVAAKSHHDSKEPTKGSNPEKYTIEEVDNEYTISKGDTLYDISNRYYGSGIYYDDIAEYNGISNPDQIKVGDTIRLPHEISDNVQLIEEQTYTISKGDNLIGICEKFYKDNSYETALRLAAYNNIEDVNLIKIGQEITIPSYDDLLKVNPYPYDYEADSIKR